MILNNVQYYQIAFEISEASKMPSIYMLATSAGKAGNMCYFVKKAGNAGKHMLFLKT